MATKRYPRFEMVDPVVADALRAMPGYKRLEMVFEMNETVRHLLAQGFKSRHPNWIDAEVQKAVAARMLDEVD